MRQSGSGLRRTFLYFSACLWGAEVALSPFFGVRVEELACGFFSLAIPKGPGRTCAIKWFGGLDQVRLTPLGEGFSPLPPPGLFLRQPVICRPPLLAGGYCPFLLSLRSHSCVCQIPGVLPLTSQWRVFFLWEWSPSGGPLQPVLQVFLSPTLCHFDSIIYF